MIIKSFFIPGIAHRSYLLGARHSCVIIDPARDSDTYLSAAEEEGMMIAGILETHLHADFISGHLELHEKTGAPVYMPAAARPSFSSSEMKGGDEIILDDLVIRVMETPGHTPCSVSYVVIDTSRGEEPVAVFTGDALFVGDAGRPDLFPGEAEVLASQLYSSLFEGLLGLPGFCEVYPTHGSGSFCGRTLGSKASTTIGYERLYNPVLQITGRDDFIRNLTTDMPPAPDHFHRCSEINRQGPALMKTYPDPVPLSPDQFSAMMAENGTVVIDTRRYDAFSAAHIPGAVNLDRENNFPTFAGWIVPPDHRILLVLHTAAQVNETVLMLRRVGLDRVHGFLKGGMPAWITGGHPITHIPLLSVREFKELRAKEPGLQVVDVRMPAEYAGHHLPGAVSVPWPDIRERYREIDENRQAVLVCGSGSRAGIAASLLRARGHSHISLLAGGYAAWSAAERA